MKKCCRFLFLFFSFITVIAAFLGDGLTPYECQQVITVSSYSSDALNGHSRCNREALECSDLQQALQLIVADNISSFNESLFDCVLVEIQNGSYTISENVEISQNVILRAANPGDKVSVTFDVFYESNDTVEYSLLFIHTDFVEIRGIEFYGSFGIIGFENVTSVTITDSSFTYFENGAIDIYMCFLIRITSCIFNHNGPVSVIKAQQFRGHSAGVSIGFDDDNYNSTGYIGNVPEERGVFISNCGFYDQTATVGVFTTSDLFQGFQFTGRGGSISILLNSTNSSNVTMEDTRIEKSFAQTFGGGIYLGFGGLVEHVSVLNRLEFIRCECTDGPAALFMFSLNSKSRGTVSDSFEVYNSRFIENRSELGGGALFLNVERASGITTPSRIQNCTFERNFAQDFGAAISLSSLQFLEDTSLTESLQIIDCTFIKNMVFQRGSGVMIVAYFPVAFAGHNVFSDNDGQALVVAGTRVEVHGHLELKNNRGLGTDSGAVYLASFGQIVFYPSSTLVFYNNSGLLGAALVVDYPAVTSLSNSYSQLVFNPFCPVRSFDSHAFLDEWNDVNITFSKNKALIGSAVYMNNVALCSWVGIGDTYFDLHEVFRWNFVHYPQENINTGHAPDSANPLWYIQTPAVDVEVTEDYRNISAYPGEEFELFVVGTDELGVRTSVGVSLTDNEGDFQFNPAADAPHNIQSSAITTYYTISEDYISQYRNRSRTPTKRVVLDTIFSEIPAGTSFTITTRECPPGYVIDHVQTGSHLSGHVCICNTEGNQYIMACQNRDIYISEGYWATVLKTPDDQDDSMFLYPCPAHYCRCFDVPQVSGNSSCIFTYNSERPYDQCHCNRLGTLCGECVNGTGFSALLNKCVSCPNHSGLLIGGLIVAQFLIIGVILALKSPGPIPPSAYPIIFFVQIVPLVSQHFPGNFRGEFALYLSSALSLYFPYDFCLLPDLSAELSYTLRYLSLFIFLGLSFPILFIRYRLKLFRVPWYGVWWVCLLLYTHLLFTSMSVLNCPQLPDRDGNVQGRWYVNGNVDCFKGGHLPLALLALLTLMSCVAVIPVIFIYACKCFKRPRPSWLRETTRALSKSFKPDLEWWSAMELIRRVVMLLLIASFPKNDYPVIFFLAISVAVCGFIKPYKDKIANILDIVLSSSTIIMLLLRNTNDIFSTLATKLDQTDVDESNITSSATNDCSEDNKGTPLVWILSPFYYFPAAVLVAALLIFCIWGIMFYLKCHSKEDEDLPNDPFEDDEAFRTIRHKSFRSTSVGLGESESFSFFSLSFTRRFTQRFAQRFSRSKSKPSDRENVVSMVDFGNLGDAEASLDPRRLQSMPGEQTKPQTQKQHKPEATHPKGGPKLTAQQKSRSLDFETRHLETDKSNKQRSSSDAFLTESRSFNPNSSSEVLGKLNESECASNRPDVCKGSTSSIQAVNVLTISGAANQDDFQ